LRTVIIRRCAREVANAGVVVRWLDVEAHPALLERDFRRLGVRPDPESAQTSGGTLGTWAPMRSDSGRLR
jgi:hypothetical protein